MQKNENLRQTDNFFLNSFLHGTDEAHQLVILTNQNPFREMVSNGRHFEEWLAKLSKVNGSAYQEIHFISQACEWSDSVSTLSLSLSVGSPTPSTNLCFTTKLTYPIIFWR